ncbi:Stk1 family PASTA domain-containing Ser/Thr kinase [Clostridiaceae bacterium HSG29]|nr:Stk1 family PASTA domain-containing Ser/Thr kinase [Clostridiaceae bacterium HSG29]
MNKDILGNRYEIINKIGEGGMAKVYKAKDNLLNRFVAIKVLKDEFKNDEEFIAKFDKEAKAAASLSHPNIVNVYDVGIDSGIRYIVMELLEGITLKEVIKKRTEFLTDNEIIDIIYQIASALEHAHSKNIIHRDIKPENIIVDDNNTVKVADFGIARAVNNSTIVNTKKVLGSVHYTSPEQARGGVVDKRTDIYSLGILMYELSTRRVPFDGDTHISIALKHIKGEVLNPTKVNSNLSLGIEKIILKSIMKNPEQRYNGAEELISDLEKASRKLDNEIIVEDIEKDMGETKYLPLIEDDEFMTKKIVNKKKKTNEKKERKKLSVFSVLVIILVALLFTLGIFTIISLDNIANKLDNEIVIVPNVEGFEATEGAKILNDSGFSVDATKRKYSTTVKDGYIISQSYEEGEELKKGYTIEIVISSGSKLITVPNVIHDDFVNGKIELENLNLVLGEVTYEYSDLPKGTIIDQDPIAGKEFMVNSKVNLVVSQGLESSSVLLPSVIDLTIEEATERLESINITIGNISYISDENFENGKINKQSILAGTEVEEGSSVDVVVTKNEETTTGNGEIENPDENTLIEKVFVIPLNFEEEKNIVKVETIIDGNSEIVYEEEHFKSEGSVRVTVQSKGEVTLKFYYGDKLISQQNRTFE